jgi:hypothetical protein
MDRDLGDLFGLAGPAHRDVRHLLVPRILRHPLGHPGGIIPGWIALTRMPRRAVSLVKPTIPAFAAD